MYKSLLIVSLSLFTGAHMQAMGSSAIIKAAAKFKSQQAVRGLHTSRPNQGILGAIGGAFAGKAIVSIIGHGTIIGLSGAVACANPALGATVAMALESTCGPMIEAYSIKGAIVGGIAGGVITGPV